MSSLVSAPYDHTQGLPGLLRNVRSSGTPRDQDPLHWGVCIRTSPDGAALCPRGCPLWLFPDGTRHFRGTVPVQANPRGHGITQQSPLAPSGWPGSYSKPQKVGSWRLDLPPRYRGGNWGPEPSRPAAQDGEARAEPLAEPPATCVRLTHGQEKSPERSPLCCPGSTRKSPPHPGLGRHQLLTRACPPHVALSHQCSEAVAEQ